MSQNIYKYIYYVGAEWEKISRAVQVIFELECRTKQT